MRKNFFAHIIQYSFTNEVRWINNNCECKENENKTLTQTEGFISIEKNNEEIDEKKKDVLKTTPAKQMKISESESYKNEKTNSIINLSESEIMKSYTIHKLISNGNYSNVYHIKCSSSQKSFAIKMQHVKVYDRKGVTRELNTLLKVKYHPFLIQLKEFEYLVNSQVLLFVMECADCDLNTYIKKIKSIPLCQVHVLTQHLLDGMSFLHEKLGIMHCDLKPHNLLICDKSLKIGDFGLCRPICDTMESYLVTRWYRCPELLKAEEMFDERIDIWSIGCIAWEMMFSRVLFPGSTERDVMTKISLFFEKNNQFQKCNCSKMKNLLLNSLKIEYKERWSASKLLSIFEAEPTNTNNDYTGPIDVSTINFEERQVQDKDNDEKI